MQRHRRGEPRKARVVWAQRRHATEITKGVGEAARFGMFQSARSKHCFAGRRAGGDGQKLGEEVGIDRSADFR
ncbi:hypothetical protein WDZ92_41085, partial [Nostoc sp. NIES-2111]